MFLKGWWKQFLNIFKAEYGSTVNEDGAKITGRFAMILLNGAGLMGRLD